jgi:hypothetical protein
MGLKLGNKDEKFHIIGDITWHRGFYAHEKFNLGNTHSKNPSNLFSHKDYISAAVQIAIPVYRRMESSFAYNISTSKKYLTSHALCTEISYRF